MKQAPTLTEYLTRYAKQTADRYLHEIEIYKRSQPKARRAKYDDIVIYFEKLRKEYSNAGTLSRILSCIKVYYDYLLYAGIRNDHPCRNFKIKDKKMRDIRHETLFTPQELNLLLNKQERYTALVLRNKIIMSLLVYQALAPKEIVRLRTDDINLDKGTIRIKASKKLNSRTLQLMPSQIKVFIDYISGVRKQTLTTSTDKLILNRTGTELTTDDIKTLVESFKPLFPDKKLHTGSIRMSVITNMLNIQKIPLNDVQNFSGQKYASTTVKYRKPDDEKNRELINQFHPLNQLFK